MSQTFSDRGYETDAVRVRAGKSGLSSRQLSELGYDVRSITLEDAARLAIEGGYCAVLVAQTGRRLIKFCCDVAWWANYFEVPARPIIVTGYWGIIYERYVEGLFFRQFCDVVCANSPYDVQWMRSTLKALDARHQPIALTGLTSTPPVPEVNFPAVPSPVRTLLFAAQPSVPKSYGERVYVLQKLYEFARKNPESQVLIKPRSRIGERANHPERYHYERLIRDLGCRMPDNVRVVYDSISELIPTVDCVVSVSSTALVEALARGTRAAVVADFLVQEKYGTHFFLRSNLLRSFDELIAGTALDPNHEWLVKNGIIGNYSRKAAVDKVEELLRQQEECGVPLESPTVNAETRRFWVKTAVGADPLLDIPSWKKFMLTLKHQMYRLLDGWCRMVR